MSVEVAYRIEKALAAYRAWSTGQQVRRCRLVQYCGPEMIGAIDIPGSEVEAQIRGLLEEGFYVDWACRAATLYLRVWEFGGAEPEWRFVFAEDDLPHTEPGTAL